MKSKLNIMKKVVSFLIIVFFSINLWSQEYNVSSFICQWEYTTPESQGMSSQKLDSMTVVLARKGTKKLIIIKNGRIVLEWFAEGWKDSESKHHTASLAKALVGGMSLLKAMDDGYITLDAAACYYIPEWKNSGQKSEITIRHLATHTSGIEDAEPTEEEFKKLPENIANLHVNLPGWKGKFWRQKPNPFFMARDSAPVLFTPGSKYAYSNPGIGMLTYAVTSSLQNSPYDDVGTYLKEQVYGPIGIEEDNYRMGYGKTFTIGGNQVVPSWGGGNFTARAVARIGLLMLHKGNWQGKQIIGSSAVEKVTKYGGTALPEESSEIHDNTRSENNPTPATTAGWYCNYDGTWPYVPRDAFAGGGAGNQHLIVIPGMNLVIVRMGSDLFNPEEGEGFWFGAEKYLLNPIMDAIIEAPYPQSDLSIEFEPKESVIRMAEGSDNWPVTWADDGELYTAYGDGWGFEPKTDMKLSLGICKVSGNPPSIKGINIRSKSGERVGQGRFGEKASGLLMVDGVLYMLIRNANNARLMWSEDHGKNWELADWKFEMSFGCPTFLNYGKNYEGAVDHYVYIYSQDDASAYKNVDRFVLARVPKNQIKDWRKYEYFAGFNSGDKPLWSEDIRKREAVFVNPGKCYRSGVTYNKGLNRFLWCQAIQSSESEMHRGVRFKGGLGIFESRHPWGPWETVYYTRDWDIGPGETMSIPTKWMSEDGKICYLLFSGDDYFSVRKLLIK